MEKYANRREAKTDKMRNCKNQETEKKHKTEEKQKDELVNRARQDEKNAKIG